LAGLLLYLRLRTFPPQSKGLKWLAWSGVPLLWLLGFLGKETAILAPLFALLIEIFILRRPSEHGQRTNHKRYLLIGIGLFTLLAGWVMFYVGVHAFTTEAFRYRNFTMYERVLTELRVLWFYLQLIVLPMPSDFGLFHDDFSISRGWFSPWTTTLAAIGWITVLGALLKYGRRWPLIGFGIAWFLVGHLLESTILALELVHEHRNYLPVFGILLAVGEAGRRIGQKYLSHMSLLKWAGVLLPLSVLIFNLALRSYAYGEPVRLAQIEAANHPNSARAQYEAGRALMNSSVGFLVVMPDARVEINHYFERATQLAPDWKQPVLAAISLACVYGDPISPALLDTLRQRWQFARFSNEDRTTIGDMATQGIRGKLCMTSNALLQQFDALLENPRLVPYDRAMVLTRMGAVAQAMNKDAKQAREYYRQALEIMPSPGVRLLYAQLLQEQGDLVAARQELAKAEAGRFDEDWQPSTARRLHELLDATHPGIDAVKAVTPLQP